MAKNTHTYWLKKLGIFIIIIFGTLIVLVSIRLFSSYQTIRKTQLIKDPITFAKNFDKNGEPYDDKIDLECDKENYVFFCPGKSHYNSSVFPNLQTVEIESGIYDYERSILVDSLWNVFWVNDYSRHYEVIEIYGPYRYLSEIEQDLLKK